MANHNPRRNLYRLGWLLLIAAVALLFINSPWYSKQMYPFPYRQEIVDSSREAGLDPLLVAAMIRKESGFNPQALSKKGAMGLMQVMPETGRWIAGRIGLTDFSPEMLNDPEYNLRLGCWYMSYLNGEFQGDWVRVLAAYNAGQGNVQQWLEGKTWDGTWENRDSIPFTQTRTYISEIAANYSVYNRLYRGEVGGASVIFPPPVER